MQFLTTNTEYKREPHFTELSHVDWHRYVSFNGSRVEIKHHDADAGNYFADIGSPIFTAVDLIQSVHSRMIFATGSTNLRPWLKKHQAQRNTEQIIT